MVKRPLSSTEKNINLLVDEVIIEFKDHIDRLSLQPEINLEEKVNTLLGGVTQFNAPLSQNLKARMRRALSGPVYMSLMQGHNPYTAYITNELTEYAKEHPRTKEYCDEQYEERHAPERATKRRKLAVSKMIGRQGDTKHRYSSMPISKDLVSLITKQLDSITSERSADRAGSRNKKSRKKKEQKKKRKKPPTKASSKKQTKKESNRRRSRRRVQRGGYPFWFDDVPKGMSRVQYMKLRKSKPKNKSMKVWIRENKNNMKKYTKKS